MAATIKIVNNSDIRKENKYFNEYITQDNKYLHLSYSSLVNNGSSLESYNEYLDELDLKFNIYKLTEKLFLCTDFIHKLPSNILKFINLKEIEVDGTRFWDLNCSQLPISITTIRFYYTNLSSDFIIGMDRLINLYSLHIYDRSFDFSRIHIDEQHNPDLDKPIPNLPVLKFINIYLCEATELYLASNNWKNKIMNHKLLSDVKNRIINMEFEEYYCFGEDYYSVIVINLQ